MPIFHIMVQVLNIQCDENQKRTLQYKKQDIKLFRLKPLKQSLKLKQFQLFLQYLLF